MHWADSLYAWQFAAAAEFAVLRESAAFRAWLLTVLGESAGSGSGSIKFGKAPRLSYRAPEPKQALSASAILDWLLQRAIVPAPPPPLELPDMEHGQDKTGQQHAAAEC